jgi:hypothetical protein
MNILSRSLNREQNRHEKEESPRVNLKSRTLTSVTLDLYLQSHQCTKFEYLLPITGNSHRDEHIVSRAWCVVAPSMHAENIRGTCNKQQSADFVYGEQPSALGKEQTGVVMVYL